MTTSVRVDQAYRLRLHLLNVDLPPGTVMWVWGAGEAPRPFDLDLLSPNGDLWTPSVAGEVIYLEIRATDTKSNNAAVTIPEIVELLDDPTLSPESTTCLKDASCYDSSTLPVIEDYRKAVAHLDFMEGGGSFVCSGALINDSDDSTTIPYLLTANHCVSSQSVASSLEAFWDYRTSSCNGSWPSISSLQRSNGSSLITTAAGSDVTLLKLNSVPSGRYYLGWDSRTSAVAPGTQLFRISHPFPDSSMSPHPQSFSRSTVQIPSECEGTPGTSYIYAGNTLGGTFGGSSGSAVITSGGKIVGQLNGGCGPDPADGCNSANQEVDGALSASYQYLEPFIGATSGSCGTCTPGTNTACLLGNRFKVEMQIHTTYQNYTGPGIVVRYAENLPEIHPTYGPLSEAAYFAAYPWAPKKVELVVKMQNGVTLNDKFWVIGGGVGGPEYWLTITDTESCRVWTHHNALNALESYRDYEAFPFP